MSLTRKPIDFGLPSRKVRGEVGKVPHFSRVAITRSRCGGTMRDPGWKASETLVSGNPVASANSRIVTRRETAERRDFPLSVRSPISIRRSQRKSENAQFRKQFRSAPRRTSAFLGFAKPAMARRASPHLLGSSGFIGEPQHHYCSGDSRRVQASAGGSALGAGKTAEKPEIHNLHADCARGLNAKLTFFCFLISQVLTRGYRWIYCFKCDDKPQRPGTRGGAPMPNLRWMSVYLSVRLLARRGFRLRLWRSPQPAGSFSGKVTWTVGRSTKGSLNSAPRRAGAWPAATIASGRYTIEREKGLPPGKYRVRLYSAGDVVKLPDGPPGPPAPGQPVSARSGFLEYNMKARRSSRWCPAANATSISTFAASRSS